MERLFSLETLFYGDRPCKTVCSNSEEEETKNALKCRKLIPGKVNHSIDSIEFPRQQEGQVLADETLYLFELPPY